MTRKIVSFITFLLLFSAGANAQNSKMATEQKQFINDLFYSYKKTVLDLKPEIDKGVKAMKNMSLTPWSEQKMKRWCSDKYIKVPLTQESKKHTFQLDSVSFRLSTFMKGGFMLECDSADFKEVKSWGYQCMKNGVAYDASFQSNGLCMRKSYMDYMYQHTDLSFGTWLRWHQVDFLEQGISEEMLRATVADTTDLDSVEVLKFNEAVGRRIASQMYSGESSHWEDSSIDKFQKLFREAYNLIIDYEGEVWTAQEQFTKLHKESGRSAYDSAFELFFYYNFLEQNPDMEIICRTMREYLKQEDSSSEMTTKLQEEKDFIDDYIAKYKFLFITMEEVNRYYQNEIPLDTSIKKEEDKYAIWYKTNLDSDCIYIYVPKNIEEEMDLDKE